MFWQLIIFFQFFKLIYNRQKSPTSEIWFERRTNYTRSLAVMSMVGYILGLG
jgi:phosphatidylinositol kinase/protein kinase (PI-3  family)